MEKNSIAAIFFVLITARHVLMDERKNDLDLVIIGKTGNGKSATGNTILGKKSFDTSPDSNSVTKTAQFDYSEYNNRTIKVVDSPGIFDTDLSQEEGLKLFIDAIHTAIALNPEGYHAFLLVVRFGSRFTEEDKKTINFIKTIFGDDLLSRFCILVVTHGDTYDPEETGIALFSDWVKTQAGSLKSLVEECGGRLILFDNKCKDEVKKKSQVDQLLTMVDRLSVLGLRYTDNHFKMALDQRERMMVESKLPMIREESLRETSLILQQLGNLQSHEPKKQLKQLDALKYRADALAQSVMKQDKGTGALKAIIENTQHIVQNVLAHMNAVNETLEIQENMEKAKRDIDELKEGREKAREDQDHELVTKLTQQIDILENGFAEKGDDTYKQMFKNLKFSYENLVEEFKSVKDHSAFSMLKSLGRGLWNDLWNALDYITSFKFLRDL